MMARVFDAKMVHEDMDNPVPHQDTKLSREDTGGTQRKGVFHWSNAEEIKAKVRDRAKQKPEAYDVKNYYYKEGICQRLARHIYFENFTLGVIVVNAIWIAIDTDENKAETLIDAKWPFVLADSLFFAYFTIELVIRFLSFERKRNCLRDGWFCFDATLVTLYLFDPFIITLAVAASGGGGLDLPTSILRLFRLARLSRLVRMLRSLPELMIMIKGMVTAAGTVIYTLGLLLLFTYVFAIAMTQLSIGTEFREKYFNGVALSMYSLIIYGTFLDSLAEFCDAIREESTACLILVTVFVVLASMTVMNMLIGILCEVISAVAEEEKESMMTDKVYNKFSALLTAGDENGDGKISWRELDDLMKSNEALQALESVNVDPVGLIDVAEDFFFEEGEEKQMTFEEFMDMVLDLRGSQQATLKDILSLGKRFNRKFMELKHAIENIDNKLGTLMQAPLLQPR